MASARFFFFLCVYQAAPRSFIAYIWQACIRGWVGVACIAASAFSARLGRASAHFVSFPGAGCGVAKQIVFDFRSFREPFELGMRCVPCRVQRASAAINEGLDGLGRAGVVGSKGKGGKGLACAPGYVCKRIFCSCFPVSGCDSAVAATTTSIHACGCVIVLMFLFGVWY